MPAAAGGGPMVAPLEIVAVPALRDNYIWIAHEPTSGATVVVDPGEAAPALAALQTRGGRADAVWITHWHPDHIGGLSEVKAATGARAFGPAAEAEKIPGLDVLLAEGDRVELGPLSADVIETPGHTLGHIAFHLPDTAVLFPGDTLFAMGCGRLFEGTPADMYDSLGRLAALPPETAVYAAHEYTAGNARFALGAEPGNQAIRARAKQVEDARARGERTLPTTIGAERDTNPFMRAGSADELGRLRAAKDRFA